MYLCRVMETNVAIVPDSNHTPCRLVCIIVETEISEYVSQN